MMKASNFMLIKMLAAVTILAASKAYALYPDPSGAGACYFNNPYAFTDDCVQYTGSSWDAASAEADCGQIFSVEGFADTISFVPGGTCSIQNHVSDCVENIGTTTEKVNLNALLDPNNVTFCGTLQGVCQVNIGGEFFVVEGAVCSDTFVPPTPCETIGAEEDCTLQEEVFEAIVSDSDVSVSPECNVAGCLNDQVLNNIWTDFRPLTAPQSSTGIIFIPGGGVDFRGYAPIANDLAAAGFYTALLPSPTASIITSIIGDPANAAITQWVLAGHSLGGVIGTTYMSQNPSVIDGIAMLASYPDADISGLNIKAMTLYGTNDLISTPVEIFSNLSKMPAENVLAKIRGGNHSGFGFYGDQDGDGDADITNAKQAELIVESIQHLVSRVEAGTTDSFIGQPFVSFNGITNGPGTYIAQFKAAGYDYVNQIGGPKNFDINRTTVLNDFIAAQPTTSPGQTPELHVAQYIEQLGNTSDINLPPIYDGEMYMKFFTQDRIEQDLGYVTENAQGQCADVNEFVFDLTRGLANYYFTEEEKTYLDSWSVVYQNDLLLSTGPDFVIADNSEVLVGLVPGPNLVILRSPSFFASLDPINGAAAGRNYCKTLSYTRAYVILREILRNAP